VLAAGMLGLQPTIGTGLIMPSFIAIIVGGIGSLPGTLLGGLLIGVASGVTTVFFPSASEAVIYVMMAAVLIVAAARVVRRGRALLMDSASDKRVADAAVWAALLLGALLAARCRRLYRARQPRAGAGARRHGAQFPARVSPACCRSAMPPISASAPTAPGLTMQISGAEHAARHAGRRAHGHRRRAIIGPMIVRLRGVYFAMCTIAFGQVFYFIAFRWSSVTGGDDGLSGWHRAPIDLGFTTIDILGNDNKAFYYFALFVLRGVAAAMALLLRSPFGRTLVAIRENERRARFLGIPVDRHIWLVLGYFLLLRQPCRRALCAAEQFRDPRACAGTVRRFRHHGGAGRHAQLLGAADRRGDLHRAAGLRLERDAELDVVHRPVLRARRAVLPARRAWHHPAEGEAMSLLRVEHVSKHFGSLIAVNDVSMTVSRANCARSSAPMAPARPRSST
jgi:hypothetical protein